MNERDNFSITEDSENIVMKKDRIISSLMEDNALLDRKIAYLYFVYQSSRKMYDKLSSQELSLMAVEIFAEFAVSDHTTLFLKDEVSENYVLTSEHHLKKDHKFPKVRLYQNSGKLYFPDRIDLKEESQKQIFTSQFYNAEDFLEKINPKWLLFIQSETSVIGFITLSQKPQQDYDVEILDVSETLCKAMYVALVTAYNFKKTETEIIRYNNRFKRLLSLNTLVKNVNSATTEQAVMTLINNTLQVSYNVNLGFIALYDQASLSLKIDSYIGMKGAVTNIPLKGELLPLLIGEKVFAHEEKQVMNLFNEQFIMDFEQPLSGASIFPIFVEEYEVKLIGALAIMGVEVGLLGSDENNLIFEFIASHIAPILYHIMRVEQVKQEYHPDYYQCFLEALASNIDGAEIFSLDLYVVWIQHMRPLTFKDEGFSSRFGSDEQEVFALDHQNVMILTSEADTIEIIKGLLLDGETLKVLKFKKDFNTIEEFKDLF